jgi:hypothetical protein
MVVFGRVVDLEVVSERSERVYDPFLFGPKDVFTLLFGGFGPRQRDDCFSEVVSISNVELDVRGFDVNLGVETVQVRNCYFSYSSGSPEGCCEAR